MGTIFIAGRRGQKGKLFDGLRARNGDRDGASRTIIKKIFKIW